MPDYVDGSCMRQSFPLLCASPRPLQGLPNRCRSRPSRLDHGRRDTQYGSVTLVKRYVHVTLDAAFSLAPLYSLIR
mgnify:CR=1 FL=1